MNIITSILYFCIIFFSNTIGAISGMGGGVIIKPSLDTLHLDPLSAINFYSSLAVFTMSIISTYKQSQLGFKINKKIAMILIVSAIIGGYLGDFSFRFLLNILSTSVVNTIQILLNLLILIPSLFVSSTFFDLKKKTHLTTKLFITGILLCSLSTLIGIGGGPINVAVFIFFFGFTIKESTVYSIILIFGSQLSKLVSSMPHISADHINISFLPIIIVAAILGGFIGAIINKKMRPIQVLIVFRLVIIFVIGLNVFNLIELIF